MKLYKTFVGLAVIGISALVQADTRRFTYTYEPETMPEGGMEYEQWATFRGGRNKTVGQEDYKKFELRHEFEYGVTDRYSVSLYVNESEQSFRDLGAGSDFSKWSFDGVSIENRYMLWNPAEKPVGLTLYLEPRFSGDEAEIEEKIILGQRFGNWKWAFNLTHATEWEDDLHKTEGEVEGTFGIARDIGKHWSVGIEVRDHNEIPEYREWENTALFVGPAVSYRRNNWWVALSVLPQIYGVNFTGDPDGNKHLELEGHERVNVRMIFSLGF
jgi:hypothetical protein